MQQQTSATGMRGKLFQNPRPIALISQRNKIPQDVWWHLFPFSFKKMGTFFKQPSHRVTFISSDVLGQRFNGSSSTWQQLATIFRKNRIFLPANIFPFNVKKRINVPWHHRRCVNNQPWKPSSTPRKVMLGTSFRLSSICLRRAEPSQSTWVYSLAANIIERQRPQKTILFILLKSKSYLKMSQIFSKCTHFLSFKGVRKVKQKQFGFFKETIF